MLLNLNTDVDMIRVGGANAMAGGANAMASAASARAAGARARMWNLQNLASDVDFIRNGYGAHVDFNGNGKGLNHVGSIDAGAGSLTSFHL